MSRAIAIIAIWGTTLALLVVYSAGVVISCAMGLACGCLR